MWRNLLCDNPLRSDLLRGNLLRSKLLHHDFKLGLSQLNLTATAIAVRRIEERTYVAAIDNAIFYATIFCTAWIFSIESDRDCSAVHRGKYICGCNSQCNLLCKAWIFSTESDRDCSVVNRGKYICGRE
ncbi:hypothetical protein CBR_g37704 [Chara braunii]|uniref:Uncharacterized protein n=1 Tax=Chara braunii TaxID=69332 RepID=A0A388JZZ1_CHABU|nr:hypothetical protein CBR_g37704 [Chara braunii]|eukprot:GBG63347.1 hypothetical protein CBR_g37704 [Chara braunii]